MEEQVPGVSEVAVGVDSGSAGVPLDVPAIGWAKLLELVGE